MLRNILNITIELEAYDVSDFGATSWTHRPKGRSTFVALIRAALEDIFQTHELKITCTAVSDSYRREFG